MEIILGEDQLNAIHLVKSFLNSLDLAFSICGYAGTGKTVITKEIVKILEERNIPYVLCAPTHIAKLVLEQATQREGVTLHKLLALSPNVEILNLDFRNLEFFTGNRADLFPINGVVICDESSMINDELFQLLIKKCVSHHSKIIFSGDKAQLQPVNAFTHSKVFNVNNLVVLTKIYRQSSENGLVEVLPILRQKIIPKFNDCIGLEGSILCYSDLREFFVKLIPSFRKSIRGGNILESKVFAYTNERVKEYNKKIKEVIFSLDSEYHQFEFLTCYENLEFNGFNFWNSMNYIVIDPPIQVDIHIPYFVSLPGWKLNLYDSSNKISEEILILSKTIQKDYLDSLSNTIEQTRLQAIDLKYKDRRQSSQYWKRYYEIINSFASPFDMYYEGRLIRKKSFDYGYASTVHKSQGTSIDNVFIDMKDIMKCRNPEELRQLQYVVISRARQNVYIYQ